MIRLLTGILSCLAIFSACSSPDNLVTDGHSDYKIVVSEEALPSEKYAAEELQHYIEKISNSKLAIIEKADEQEKLIYVGFKGVPANVLKDLKPDEFENEEYIIRGDKDHLLIAGGGSRGTLYGVMGFLSDHLGCRWYTKAVTKIPSLPSIPLPQREDRQKPALEYRNMNWREMLDTSWVLHNRVNGMRVGNALGGSYITYPFVHTFYQLVSPEKYFRSYPEYFSEVNGKRLGEKAQLCLTNPEVVKIATATVYDWIREQPEANVFSIDQNDYGNYCTCVNCRAIDEKEGSPSGSIITFVNRIADAIHQDYPEVKLQTLAYDYSVDPPKNVRPRENVMIRLCHYQYCSSHPIAVCEVNRPFYNQLKEWEKIAGGRLTIWDYLTDFRNYLMPFPNFGSFSQDVKFYADNGVKGLFNEGDAMGGGEFGELRSWVLAQLMWNPSQNAQQLIDEFVTNVYGPAAPYIADYIRLLHGQIDSATHLSMWAEPFEVNYLSPATIAKADSLFDSARVAAGEDAALLDRVELAHLPILWLKLNSFSQGGTLYVKTEELPDYLARFTAMVDKHHIVETGAFQNDFGKIGRFIDRVKAASETEFYNQWWVIGPFDNTDNKAMAVAYAPELEFDTSKVYTGKDGKNVSWKKYGDLTTGYVDFNNAFGYSEYTVAYARGIIHSSESETARFGVGNNDGIRIWLNGKMVYDYDKAALGPNQHFFTARLNKGENSVLVKVDQLRHGWGFYFARMKGSVQ